MRVLKLLLLASVWIVSLPNLASADLIFAQWAKGPADKRAIYIAGVVETAGVYSEILGYVDRWKKCLGTLNLSYGEIDNGALEFAKKHEFMNSQPAPAVIIAYVNNRCGFNNLGKPK